MVGKLTTPAVRNAKAASDGRRQEIADGGTRLYLVVQPTGAKSWAFRYRHEGRPRKLTLGPALTLQPGEAELTDEPAIGRPLSLGAARSLASAQERLLSRGIDPAAAVEARRAAKGDSLVADLVEDYLEKHARVSTRPRSAAETERLMRKKVLPRWGARACGDITRRDVVALLDEIAAEGARVSANRVLAAVRAMFNWALQRGVVEVSPCAGLKSPTREISRDRVLNDEELRRVWHACDRLGEPFGAFVRLLIATGQRKGEVAQMQWSELDLPNATWRIPGRRAKNGEAHDVPLSDLALGVIASLPRIDGEPEYVFTTRFARQETAEADERRLAPISGFSKTKTKLDSEITGALRQEAVELGRDPHNVKSIPPWRFHDLRRTAATGLARLGIAQTVVERVLNHVGSSAGITAVYQRYEYADEKKKALQAWGEYIETLISVLLKGGSPCSS